MKHLFSISFLLAITFATLSLPAQTPIPYQAGRADLPEWVQLMYAPDADPGKVKVAYDNYYKNNPFEKNQHTQYYKRWMMAVSRNPNGTVNDVTISPEMAQNEKHYMELYAAQRGAAMKGTSAWSPIGPIDFDKEAASVSYAAGAAHLYTVEQSLSNPDILYAGSANAGVWKSTDKGLSWTASTGDMLVSSVLAVEIDFTDPSIAYFGGGGKVYKTTDGGSTWNQTGSAAFNTTSYSVNDIVSWPSDHLVLWIATNNGLFRSSDGGTNWTMQQGGTWQEIEVHPTNNNILYAVKQVSTHTEFYKSTDAGLTWTPRAGGWPGVGSIASSTFNAAAYPGATSAYTSFTNIALGTTSYPDFTIEMRVRSTGWTGDPAILSNKNWASGNNPGFVIAGNTSGGTWKFNMGTGAARVDLNGGIISDGDWHHIAVVYRASGAKEVWQDGAMINTTGTFLSSSWTTSYPLAIGQDGTLAYGSAWNGGVAEVRVWGTALSSSTMDTWRCSTVNSSHPDWGSMISYWKMDEGTGTIVGDSKGSNTGTHTGTSSWSPGNTTNCIAVSIVAPDEQKRTEIAVTPAAPNLIYAFATGEADGGSGLYGIYASHDAGETWTFNCCGTGPAGVPNAATNKNLCAWADDGSDDGGQYYYDLALAASPVDSNRLHAGAVNHWISTDAGVTWDCPSKWSHSYKPNYVHADIHDIRYYGSDLWFACDGGTFYSDDAAATVNRRMYGISGTDFWGFGMGHWDGRDVMLGGTYHNGTLLKDNNVYNNGWLSTGGGDNIFGAVNYGDDRMHWSDYGRKKLSGDRLVAIAGLPTGLLPSSSYITGEEAEMEMDPRCYNKLYMANGATLWKSTDAGANFDAVYVWPTGKITSIEVSYSNPDYIYVVHYPGWWDDKTVWRSTDGGVTFTDITPSDALFNNANLYAPFDIAVSTEDPNTLWLARTIQSSGYSNLNGYKVYKTTDAGATWSNITTPTLDGEYLTNIIFQRGSNGGVYLGTRRTVYYRDNTLPDWQIWSAGLPAQTFSTQLLADYKGQTIRNATNRSVWERSLYASHAPVAQISVDKQSSNCVRDTFYFRDYSALSATGASWSWSFPGGTPATSTLQNPKVVYSSAGLYTVSLTVTDANGSNSQTLTDFISVSAGCEPDTIPGNLLSLDGTGYSSIPDLNLNTNTVTYTAWVKRNGFPADWAGIVFTRGGTTTNGLSLRNTGELRYHWDNSYWGWSSGLTVPDNEWTHVALVVTPTDATIYMNGVGVTNTAGHAVEAFDYVTDIGWDRSSGSRKFNGGIDEVCIYNRALSQDEIRDLMHLTKDPLADASLVSYYQFNETSGLVMDRAGLRHATLSGAAARTPSSGPFGGGSSHRMTVNTPGTKVFTGTGLEITFPSTGVLPDGELVAYRINLDPDVLPGAFTDARSYWIVRNWGVNATFDPLTEMTFRQIGDVSAAEALTPSDLSLYKRASNADGPTWGTAIDSADAATAGLDGDATFNAGLNVTSFSQFDILHKTMLVGGNAPPLTSKQEILIFPNPLAGGEKLHILTGTNDSYEFIWTNAEGKKLGATRFTGSAEIDLGNLSAGVYFYRLASARHMQFGEVLISR